MNTLLKTLCIALIALGFGDVTSSAQTTAVFKLKHRSSFSSAPARNPFWPIGWVKGAAVQSAEQETAVSISADSFQVTSISISSAPQAIINGKIYGEGETMNALYAGQPVKIQIIAIHDGDVVLQCSGKRYTVQLKRPELSHKGVSTDVALPKKDDVVILH